VKSLLALIVLVVHFSVEDIILDIYNSVAELGETDYEQLQTDLYALHEHPIDLNNTDEEELRQLVFLSPQQIDAILAYADKHPFESLYELQLLPCLADYEIRDLLPFVQISRDTTSSGIPSTPYTTLYAREVFAKAGHEIVARTDARNIEDRSLADPMFAQFRYRFDYQRRVIFGAQLRRPVAGQARDLTYGAYLQLRDIGRLHTLVAGNYQASFGHGLVLAPVFHTGKSMYIRSVGQQRQGLRYYSSVDGGGMHGIGATLRWNWGKQIRLDVSALYSMKRANDSIWQHTVGANMTMRHKQLEVQLTAIENIWSDSISPSRNAAYNRHYFRGFRQAVIGASARYNHGWFDAFAELATAQNYNRFAETSGAGLNTPHWGFGAIAGSRFYPAEGVALVALYRYYSPFFDNAWGYAFSETSRLGDEHGGYLGFDITRLRRWRFSGYGDVFYFSGVKYGIPDTCTVGYDALFETRYLRPSWQVSLRLRAREKGAKATYSARLQFDWKHGGWSLRTTADANYVLRYGVSIAQDLAYEFRQAPLSLRLRGQFFDVREWDNRIYLYEHDVLYAFSIPVTYGLGGRIYLNLRWQMIPQLALYLRVSETLYQAAWASEHDRAATRTDVHLMLRAKL
jgi:hypothetical protein